MDELVQWLWVALWTAATAVGPSLVYLALRRPSAPAGERLAGWWCLWAGQLVVPLVLVAWGSLVLGEEMRGHGSLAAAVVFGAGGAMIAALLTRKAVELWRLGASILRQGVDPTLLRRASRAAEGSLVGPLGTAVLLGLMFVVPIPGRFGHLIYLVLVVGPVGIASVMLVAVSFGVRRLLRRP